MTRNVVKCNYIPSSNGNVVYYLETYHFKTSVYQERLSGKLLSDYFKRFQFFNDVSIYLEYEYAYYDNLSTPRFMHFNVHCISFFINFKNNVFNIIINNKTNFKSFKMHIWRLLNQKVSSTLPRYYNSFESAYNRTLQTNW